MTGVCWASRLFSDGYVVTIICPVVVIACGDGKKATARGRDARGHKQGPPRGSRVHLDVVAPQLSRGRQGQEADAREPLAPGRGVDRADPGLATGRALRRAPR